MVLPPRPPPPLKPILLAAFVLLLSSAPRAAGARILFGKKKEKVSVHKTTIDPNPRLDHIPFDPLVEEFEEKQDDRAWEREYFKRHYEEMKKRKLEYMKRHGEHDGEHANHPNHPHRAVPQHGEHRPHHQMEAHHSDVHHRTDGDVHRHVSDEHHRGEHDQFHLHDEVEHGDDHGQPYEDHYGEAHEGYNEDEYVSEETHDESEDDYKSSEDYFDEERFNITKRLSDLFPLIDNDPRDNLISLPELSNWHLSMTRNGSLHRTERELLAVDLDHDGHVTLKEYLKDSTPGDAVRTDWSEDDKEWVEKSKGQFPLADLDGDGKLNKTEFNDFLHPEDSENPKLLQFTRLEEMKKRDSDHDGKLGWDDFYHNIFDELHGDEFHDEESFASEIIHGIETVVGMGENSKEAKAKQKFHEYDKNNDMYLDDEEFIPIMNKINPNEKFFAGEQAKHLIDQADDNHDGKLELHEMTSNPYVFYTTVYENGGNSDDYSHDEF